jgi:hypothetical protein
MSPNIAASVKARLLRQAREAGDELELVFVRFACERLVSCQRSPEPVLLRWKGMESEAEGDFYVRSGPGTVKLAPESAREYVRTRFGRG